MEAENLESWNIVFKVVLRVGEEAKGWERQEKIKTKDLVKL